jgi:uncharacterized protein
VILFCDTGALIKLLISEPGSDQMEQSSSHAEAIAICRITWAEAMAGMARRQREDPISGHDIEQARQRLILTWDQFTIVEVSPRLVETAGRFADVFALRGYDCVTAGNWQQPMNSTRARTNHRPLPPSIADSCRQHRCCTWRCWHDQHSGCQQPDGPSRSMTSWCAPTSACSSMASMRRFPWTTPR